MSNWYEVYSREYSEGYGYPPEYSSFFIYVKADNVTRAKVLALRWFRRNEPRWNLLTYHDENPFTGMTVNKVEWKEMGLL